MKDGRFAAAYIVLGVVAVVALVAAVAMKIPSADERAYAAVVQKPKPLIRLSYGELEDQLGDAAVVGPDEQAGVPAGCRAYQRQNYVLLLCKNA